MYEVKEPTHFSDGQLHSPKAIKMPKPISKFSSAKTKSLKIIVPDESEPYFSAHHPNG
jgi:hypothetical protein